MIIEDIELHTVKGRDGGRHYIFLEVFGEGLSGWGEVYGGRPPWSVVETTVATEYIGESVVGVEWSSPSQLIRRMEEGVRHLKLDWGKGAVSRVIAAFDQAVHDLYAKAEGKPLYQVLGGRLGKLDIYVSLEDGQDILNVVEKWRSVGVDKFKIILSGELERDIKTVKKVYDALGEKVFIDADMGYSMEEALSLMKEVGDLIGWFEDPVYMDDIGALDMVKRIAIMNFDEMYIAGGERIYDKYDLLRLFEKYRLIDVYIPDLTKTVGYLTALELIETTNKNKVLYSPYASGSLHSLYASVNLALARGGCWGIGINGSSPYITPETIGEYISDGELDTGQLLRDEVGIGYDPTTYLNKS